jgi:hypothetical protein
VKEIGHLLKAVGLFNDSIRGGPNLVYVAALRKYRSYEIQGLRDQRSTLVPVGLEKRTINLLDNLRRIATAVSKHLEVALQDLRQSL